MQDENEKHWGDLLAKLKKELIAQGFVVTEENATRFHNRLWEILSETFMRGKRSGPISRPW